MSKKKGNKDSSEHFLAKGLILAFHYVPEEIEPTIPKFWQQATYELAEQGFLLIVLTTTPLLTPGINQIDVPYSLIDFSHRPQASEEPTHLNIALAEKIMRWYDCSPEVAVQSAITAQHFYADLLDRLQPAAVLTWQSTSPTAGILQELAQKTGIPLWNTERGWLRETLMIDTGQNTYLNELQTSFSLAHCQALFPTSEQDYQNLKTRVLSRDLTGRYPSEPLISASELRIKYGIPEMARIFAFFMHGEPFLLKDANEVPAQLHQLSLENLTEQIDQLGQYCKEKGMYLLIQDHPFNEREGIKLAIKETENTIHIKENIHSVLTAAERLFFTTSTIQYDAIFYEKPYGVLCRSSADIRDGSYQAIEHMAFSDFIHAVDAARDWEKRHKNLKSLVIFLSKFVLFDLSEDQRQASVIRFVEHLSKFIRPVDQGLPERIDQLLEKWKN